MFRPAWSPTDSPNRSWRFGWNPLLVIFIQLGAPKTPLTDFHVWVEIRYWQLSLSVKPKRPVEQILMFPWKSVNGNFRRAWTPQDPSDRFWRFSWNLLLIIVAQLRQQITPLTYFDISIEIRYWQCSPSFNPPQNPFTDFDVWAEICYWQFSPSLDPKRPL